MTRRLPGALLVLALARCGGGEAPVTFHAQVAPLLHAECAPCHRPEGAAPFPLLTYEDARSHARQIADVTRRRFMPPWLPAPGGPSFVGQRRLTDGQLSTIERWVAQGAPAGDLEDSPPPPVWPAGWQLGPPDLELGMAEPYALAAEGRDEYRNFVVPSPVTETRYVRAVEFRPGNARAVHHARLLLDHTPLSRRRDAESPEAGFSGMDAGTAESPEGHLLGWTPGKVPQAGRDDLAWRLDPGDDLVLQLHMVPTGKPEAIRATLGLHFAERPPALHPFALVLGSRDIDIPPGERDFRVRVSYTLPVEVEALGIYPHAHYTAHEMKVEARLPDGSLRALIEIPRWDFNWQDEYRYAPPVPLPAGSTIEMNYGYDNSAENPRNPSQPPRRVVYGPSSTDEMAEVSIQVLPRDDAQLALLRQDFERWRVTQAVEYRRRMLDANPRDAASHAALGSSYVYLGRLDLALEHLTRALALAPGDARLEQNTAYVLRELGRREEALGHYRRALELDPSSAESAYDLGRTLQELGRAAEALASFRGAIALRPEAPGPHEAAARVLAENPALAPGGAREALRLARRAVELSPDGDPRALDALGLALAATGDVAGAAEAAARALSSAKSHGAAELAREIETRLARYRAAADRR